MFGLIILFFIIFIIAFANYWWSVFKARDQLLSIEKFIKRFEIAREQNAYKEILNSFKLSTDSLSLLANSYVKSGDFETAIEIYLIALKQAKGRFEKKQILVDLGKAYFKAGFLQRSAEVFLESLRLAPRNEIALKYLVVCHESLKSYDLSLEALDALEELGTDVKEERAYMRAKSILENDSLEVDKKIKKLQELRKDFELISRFIIELKNIHHLLSHEDFRVKNPYDVLDLAWILSEDGIDFSGFKDGVYKEIAKVRGQIESSENIDTFELEVLDKLKSIDYQKADLSFQFTCKNCKRDFPMFFYRCPNCHTLSSVSIEPVLARKDYETYISFQ